MAVSLGLLRDFLVAADLSPDALEAARKLQAQLLPLLAMVLPERKARGARRTRVTRGRGFTPTQAIDVSSHNPTVAGQGSRSGPTQGGLPLTAALQNGAAAVGGSQEAT